MPFGFAAVAPQRERGRLAQKKKLISKEETPYHTAATAPLDSSLPCQYMIPLDVGALARRFIHHLAPTSYFDVPNCFCVQLCFVSGETAHIQWE